MDANKKPPIDPKVLVSMAEKLNYTPDKDPLLSQKSAEPEEAIELDEAVLVEPEPESDAKTSDATKEDDSRIKLPVGSFPQIKNSTVQPWANISAARIGFVLAALGVAGTFLYTFANSRSGTQEASVPKPTPTADPIDPNEEKIRSIQKDKTLSDVRGAMGDQANSMSDSKDKKLPTAETSPPPTTSSSPTVTASPAAVASPPLAPIPIVKAAKPAAPSILPSQPVAKIPTAPSNTTPSKQQTIASLGNRESTTREPIVSGRTKQPAEIPAVPSNTKASKQQTIASLGNKESTIRELIPAVPSDTKASKQQTIASLGNREVTTREKVASNRPGQPAKKPVENTTVAMASPSADTQRVKTNNKAQKDLSQPIANLGNRSNQPVSEPVTPINPQDLGSVGASGNVSSNGGNGNQPPAPAQLASNNSGGNPNNVNKTWGLTDQGVPIAQAPAAAQSGQQPPSNAPASQGVGIYTPPSLTDYFRDTADGNSQPAPVASKVEERPQAPIKVAMNLDRATQPLQLAQAPPPPLNPATKDNVKAEDKVAPPPQILAVPAQNQANRLFSVGTSGKAVTLMPIIYGNKVQNVVPKYEIALVEPMIDKTSKAGFPVGTRFIVTPSGAASDIGEIQLDVISVKLPTSQEFTPPAGSIVVRAENGGLLLGEDYFNRGSQIAGRNLNRVILGGLATVGSNANRPTVSISTIFGGAGNVTTNNAEPNFWLSLLEGSAKEGLSIATEENQAAIKEALAAPKVFKLNKNLKVQVYTNSTIVF
jgi:hypothetical protein